MTLTELNALGADEFVARLGGIFEHSPWVAQGATHDRPFVSVNALHSAMCGVVRHADIDQQLALIRAHPQLAGKAAIRGELTVDSTREQTGAGLDQCSAEEFAELTALNDQYQQHFGFPFILAVRGHTRSSIIVNMRERVGRSTITELGECLAQIERIAAFRLADAIGE